MRTSAITALQRIRLMPKMVKVAPEVGQTIRDGKLVPNSKWAALVQFVQAVVVQRGFVDRSPELSAFYAAGYTSQQALEVMLAVSMKTLSNYVVHLTQTPVDAAFVAQV